MPRTFRPGHVADYLDGFPREFWQFVYDRNTLDHRQFFGRLGFGFNNGNCDLRFSIFGLIASVPRRQPFRFNRPAPFLLSISLSVRGRNKIGDPAGAYRCTDQAVLALQARVKVLFPESACEEIVV